MAITATLTATDTEVDADECVECGATDETVEAYRTYCGYRSDAEGQFLCDDCRPRCHGACCDPDYFNDLLFDN